MSAKFVNDISERVFVLLKGMMFDYKITEVCSSGSYNKYGSIDSDSGLA